MERTFGAESLFSVQKQRSARNPYLGVAPFCGKTLREQTLNERLKSKFQQQIVASLLHFGSF